MHIREQLPYSKTFVYSAKKINYQVLGKGKKIVLVHGAFNHNVYDAVLPFLIKTHKLYVLHLPGFGGSDSIRNIKHNTDLFADVLNEFIKKNKLQKVSIVALSLGAVVALKAAAKGSIKGNLILLGLPGRVSQLVRIFSYIPVTFLRFIVATNFGKKKLLVPSMKTSIGLGSEEEILSLLKYTDIKSVVDINYYQEIEKDLPKIFHTIKNKMHIIYGENDPLRYTTSHLFKKYVVIKGSTHDIFSNMKAIIKEIKKGV